MKQKLIVPCAAAAVLLLVLFFMSHYPARVRFELARWANPDPGPAARLGLSAYKLVFSRAIPGIKRNFSGLTWNPDTRTLFGVTNNKPRVVELTRNGVLLRRIRLHGFEDTEAIEYIGGGRYVVAEERKQKLSVISIDMWTDEIMAHDVRQSIVLGEGDVGNQGVEGLALDRQTGALWAVKEYLPRRVYEVLGFPDGEPVQRVHDELLERLFVADLAGLDCNNRLGHLLVLSELSNMIIELDRQGQPVDALELQGLEGQPEGIAMDDDGILYIAAEPNFLYVYAPAQTAP